MSANFELSVLGIIGARSRRIVSSFVYIIE